MTDDLSKSPTGNRADDGWLLAASQNTTHRRLAETLMDNLVSRQSRK
jgi:hypothetical protein